jgi:hypothetical protein
VASGSARGSNIIYDDITEFVKPAKLIYLPLFPHKKCYFL